MPFHSLNEGFKSSSYLTETLLDPELGHAYEDTKTAFNKAHDVKEDLWTWFEAPDNRLRLARFGASMNGVKNMTPPEAILEGSITLGSFCIAWISQLKHQTDRVRLGTAPRGFSDHRRWRRRRLTVLGARQPPPSPSFRCPRPRTRRTSRSRGM